MSAHQNLVEIPVQVPRSAYVRPVSNLQQLTVEDVAEEVGVSADVATVLWHVWSRCLGSYSGQRSAIEQVMAMLKDAMLMEFEEGGLLVAAPLPGLASTTFPAGKTALRALGMTPAQLDDLWRRQRGLSRDRPLLPLEIVLAFLPVAAWRALATFIAWGPVEAQSRLDVLVLQYESRRVTDSRALRDPHSHGLAPKTIASRMGSVRALMRRIVDVRGCRIPSDGLLDDWSEVPPFSANGGYRNWAERNAPVTDRSAPSLRELRRALKLADRAVQDARRTKQGRSNMMKLLRARALLAVATVTGLRIDALRTALVGHYRRNFAGWADGAVMSALEVPTIKSHRGRQAKPLPPLVEEWLVEYLEYVGYARIERHEDGTLLRRANGRLKDWTITADESWPLWVSRFRRDEKGKVIVDAKGQRVALPRGLSEGAMYSLFAGAKGNKRGKTWTQMPLISHRAGRGNWHGYSPHAYRHAADQLAVRAAWDIRPQHQALAHWAPEDFAHALLDQGFANKLGATYGDKEANRNWGARLAGTAIWELAWGDAGAETARDIAREQHALAALKQEQANLALHTGRKQTVLREMELLDGDTPAPQCTGDALVRWYGERERGHRALNRQLIRVTDDIDAARVRVGAADTELQLAKQARVPVDDLMALDAIEELTADDGATEESSNETPELKRGYVWSGEAAAAFDISENTMKRWRAGKFGERVRVPWDRPAVGQTLCPPWEQVGPRRFKLWVIDLETSGRMTLDPSRVPPQVLERLRTLMEESG